MNIKSGAIEQFEHYSQFSSLTEFNRHIEMWMSLRKHDFTKSELVGFKRLVRFAAKVPGVCNAKIGTITKAIYEEYNGNGISRSTFKRMVQKAISFGILTVYETERKNGSQSSNLYVFNRFPKSEPPEGEILNHHNKTGNLFKTKIKDQNKRQENVAEKTSAQIYLEEQELDYSFTNDRVPSRFVQLVKCFFPEAKTIEEYWKMTKIAAYRNNREKETETVLDYAIDAFKQMIRKAKTGKVRNYFAYYYGILDKKFHELFMDELHEMGFGASYTVATLELLNWKYWE